MYDRFSLQLVVIPSESIETQHGCVSALRCLRMWAVTVQCPAAEGHPDSDTGIRVDHVVPVKPPGPRHLWDTSQTRFSASL